MRVLNNFVAELMSVAALLQPCGEWSFTNPREGWVYISSAARAEGDDRIWISLDSEGNLIAHGDGASPVQEAMRYLSKGEHRLSIRSRGRPLLERLVVRAIPELIFCKFQYDPHIPEFGPYDWDFLKEHVLPNVNVIVGSGAERHRPLVEEWKRRGGRWIVEIPATPYFEGWDAERAYRYWAGSPGMSDPLLDGIIVDEFGGGDNPAYPAIIESIRRLKGDGRFKGKLFYPYCGSMYGTGLSREFIETVIGSGYRFAWERYLPEQPDEEAAARLLDERLSGEMRRWREGIPGCAEHMIVCLGYLVITESLNVDPSVDFKVWMDMQFQRLATDPAFSGIYGVMEYTCGYADEETVRWAARLYRHYCIEGQTELLSRRYGFKYKLDHIRNPDFEEGLEGWKIKEAEEGSVRVRRMEGYSWLQGRYPRTERGDVFLWMRRSDRGPNVISQEIRNLEPGRLYSLKMITADYGDLVEGRSVRREHGIFIRIEGVDPLPERCFRSVIPNNYAHQLGPFTREHRFWFNYHWMVFKARGSSARLIISDWDGDKPGGPIGQELILNFIEVQPYYETEDRGGKAVAGEKPEAEGR